jgi:prephenate dehydratase
MARIACLGPEYTFSHDVARKHFADDSFHVYDDFNGVVSAVADGACDRAVIPFYNTTRRSIEEAQRVLIASLGQVFVTDVIPFDVHHYVCGFGNLRQITQLWSKSVVFQQASRWIAAHLPRATTRDFPSTSAAILALSQARCMNAAAIGTISAYKHYRVPVIVPRIENKPNVTLFFVITRHGFDPAGRDHILVCLPNAAATDIGRVGDIATRNGCAVSTNWTVGTGGRRKAYFVELTSPNSTLDLHAAVDTLTRTMRRVRVCGGYVGKCITSLIWEPMKPIGGR